MFLFNPRKNYEARRLLPGATCWIAVPCSSWIFMSLGDGTIVEPVISVTNTNSFTNMFKVTRFEPSHIFPCFRTWSLYAFVSESVPSSFSMQETLNIPVWLRQTSLPDVSLICDLVSFWLFLASANKRTNTSFGLQDCVPTDERNPLGSWEPDNFPIVALSCHPWTLSNHWYSAKRHPPYFLIRCICICQLMFMPRLSLWEKSGVCLASNRCSGLDQTIQTRDCHHPFGSVWRLHTKASISFALDAGQQLVQVSWRELSMQHIWENQHCR